MKLPNKIVSVDVGGTFCDAVLNEDGVISTLKLLSTGVLKCKVLEGGDSKNCIKIEENWHLPYPYVLEGCDIIINEERTKIKKYDTNTNSIKLSKKIKAGIGEILTITMNQEAPIFAAHLLTGIPVSKSLSNVELRVGTTRATNAMLEQKGTKCIWITNKGFKDLLYIKTQQRPHIFQLNIPEPTILHKSVIEINARIGSKGEIINPLTHEELISIISQIPKIYNIPIAISLLHSYKNVSHENQIRKALEKEGYKYVYTSARLQPSLHFLPRSETVVCNAYLSPIMDRFIQALLKKIDPTHLYFISSAGNLIHHKNYTAKDSLFSGPAGGIKAAEHYSKYFKLSNLITFDMGGTSTDTARIDSKGRLRFHSQIGEYKIASPSYEIETVAAGGGSIIDYVDGKFKVGPESAGAFPGPACYKQKGPLTVTDLNLLLGRLIAEKFNIPINIQASNQRLNELLKKAGIQNVSNQKRLSVIEGILQIANEKMADAIKKISIGQGYDTRKYSLFVFGGAGGLHACGIAEILKINQIVIPYNCGVLSAMGISNSNIEKIKIKQINKTIDFSDTQWLKSEFENLEKTSIAKNNKNKHEPEYVKSRNVYMRYLGQNQIIELEYSDQIQKEFNEAYITQFGSLFDKSLEIEKISVQISNKKEISDTNHSNLISKASQKKESGNIDWLSISPGHSITGPAIVYHNQATVYIAPGWKALAQENRDLVLNRTQVQTNNRSWTKEINIELFSNRFKSIAEQMGVQLQRSAFSVNVKERLDFSCAILNDKGYLIANAPHIPVHLGSLGISARMILKDYKLAEGDVLLTNHPLYGGSHLPDLTLIKSVYSKNKLIGYVMNRAHHAEIGGITPGSMPTNAKILEDEGVVFPPAYIIKDKISYWNEIKDMLHNAKYPSRDPVSNELDLKAAIESLNTGEKLLKQLCKDHDSLVIKNQMNQILSEGSGLVKKYIHSYLRTKIFAEEKMDDGSLIKLSIQMKDSNIYFDFTGTSPVHTGNLNANKSILYSVIVYVLRLVIDKDIPLNDGLMKKVKIKSNNNFITPNFELESAQCPAVVGGNTEVSQRLTDTILKAFNIAACSQGTMNNFLFGNKNYTYYETIGGGVGATANSNGRSAIHQHMTNTKITDPEELELKYPVILEEFCIRKSSGGKGLKNGGNGIVRRIKFKEPMIITILAQHRNISPYGINKGAEGKRGKQYLIRNGKKIALTANQNITVESNESIEINTPGGGAWGKPSSNEKKKTSQLLNANKDLQGIL